MAALTAANLLSYSAQIAMVALAAGAMQALLRVRWPAFRHVYWQTVLVACLLLPWLQTFERVSMSTAAPTTPIATTGTATSFPAADAPLTTDREAMLFSVVPGGPYVAAKTFEPILSAFIESAVEAVRQWRYESPQGGVIAFDVTVHFVDARVPLPAEMPQ